MRVCVFVHKLTTETTQGYDVRLIPTLAVLSCVAYGCHGVPALTPAPQASGEPTSQAGNDTFAPFAVVGRTVALDPNDPSHLRFGWPGVAFGVTFHGTSLDANIHDLADTFNGQTVDSYYDVAVDGNAPTTVSITTQAQRVPLVSNLADGNHTLWLTRRTEGMLGSTELFGFTTSPGGSFLPPPALPKRHIEMIGASIESGYGVGGLNCTGYVPAQQDQSLAWPQLTANALQADLMNTSYSGKGLISNIDPDTDPKNLLPTMIALADPMLFSGPWDFSKWTADVVLFDVGGNDWSGLGQAPDANQFDAAFVALVQTTLTRYPKAEIYITLNSTDTGAERNVLGEDYKSIVATLNQAGLTHVHYFEFPLYTGTDFGCDGHPTAALHQTMANQIAAQIKTDLGW